MQNHTIEQYDKIDLVEFFSIIFKYRVLVLTSVIVSIVIASFYITTLPTIYKASVILIPVEGSSNKVKGKIAGLIGLGSRSGLNNNTEQEIARLRTKDFLAKYIREENLKPALFPDRWDGASGKWLKEEPSEIEAAILLKDMISVSTNEDDVGGVVKLSVEWENPGDEKNISNIINKLVSFVNESAQKRSILKEERKIAFLERGVGNTNVSTAKVALYRLIEASVTSIALSKVQDDFVFEIIDPAINPKHAERKPIFILIFIGLMFGFIFGSIAAVILNSYS